MIAGLLPEDDRHNVGGSVEVNGVSSKDENIIWSVSDAVIFYHHSFHFNFFILRLDF